MAYESCVCWMGVPRSGRGLRCDALSLLSTHHTRHRPAFPGNTKCVCDVTRTFGLSPGSHMSWVCSTHKVQPARLDSAVDETGYQRGQGGSQT